MIDPMVTKTRVQVGYDRYGGIVTLTDFALCH